MKLKNNSLVELIAYSAVDKEEIRKQYLSWLNNLDIVQAFGPLSMVLPKDNCFIDASFERFTSSGTIGFFIYDLELKQYLGTCKLDKISIADRSAEIGIMIGEVNAQGKGVGKNAYFMLLDYAFNVLGMNRVWGTCFSDNIGSIKLFESTGFIREGKQREAIFRKGKYFDNLLFSVLKDEYSKANE